MPINLLNGRAAWFVLMLGACLGAAALLLAFLDYQHAVRRFSSETYALLIAFCFAALGVWVGRQLTPRRDPQKNAINETAIQTLGISPREHQVLTRLADGRSNKEIARLLGVSPNTVKSQVSSLFVKLDASSRTQAVNKARALKIIGH